MTLSISKTYGSIRKDSIPFLLHNLKEKSHIPLLFIGENERDMRSVATVLEHLSPENRPLCFPAWDCLPYDRLSPTKECVAERSKTLSHLEKGAQNVIVLTTVNAFVQKIPPKAYFRHTGLPLTKGQKVDIDQLVSYLSKNHYQRLDTVRERGEYAIRGGLVDIFPSDAKTPIRVDLFGDEIEAIHRFDPLSQRRGEPVEAITLTPLEEGSIGDLERERFKTTYRELFGPPRKTDEIYHRTLQGLSVRGIEHWSPLFYDHMVTLLDYLEDPHIIVNDRFESQVTERLAEIQDYYQERLLHQSTEEGPVYNPLPPETLYAEEPSFLGALSKANVTELSALTLPPSEKILDGGTKGLPFSIHNNDLDPLKTFLKAHKKQKILFSALSKGACERLGTYLKENHIDTFVSYETWEKALAGPKTFPGLVPLPVETGFMGPDFILITDHDLMGDRLRKVLKKKKRADLFIAEASSINVGDYLVHDHHGVGQYQGLVTVDIHQASHDCLLLVYEGGDKLFVPVENLDILTRYGGDTSVIRLDKLGQTAWQMRKAKVKKNLLELAEHLMKTAAARKYHPSDPIHYQDGLYDEFISRFPFTETDDQLKATEDVLSDLSSGQAMDRLICGDVGFGKTEVAMRAAFAVATSGKQVAVITPTTLLCRQHYITFKTRFEGLGMRIETLSRLVKPAQGKKIKAALQAGDVDIVVGTHTLLSGSVAFKELGLIIVDEEQHFGVKQKEKLKELKTDVHVLTLTATPIPRTLQMSLSGVREMSIIATPPVDRLAVRTFVTPYDSVVIKEALIREHNRGGQSFYVCPRIKDLKDVHEKLEKLVPDLKVVTAHGQMTPSDLEDVMDAFYSGQYDILLATNIIESGIDVPNANTLIVHRSDLFGLSQLYQLRGRIGRAKQRAYAYFTLSNFNTLSKNAARRLDVMQTLDSLGAGFQLASHDMDIRGAGNVLGDQQSGHIKEIGVELYQKMLQEALEELKARKKKKEAPAPSWSPTLNLGIPVLIPEDYVADLSVRLELYRRLSHMDTAPEIDSFKAELIDRFGDLPPEVHNLLHIIHLKHLCKTAHVEKIDLGPKGFTVSFFQNTVPNPEALLEYVHQNPFSIKLKPNQSLVFLGELITPNEKIKTVGSTLKTLCDMTD